MKLRIPNEEVFIIYTNLVRSWLEGKGTTSGYTLIEFLLNNDLQGFAEDFPHFFRESVSYFDTGQNHPEKFYHGFIIGMLQTPSGSVQRALSTRIWQWTL